MPISVWISKVVSNPMERYVSSYFEKLGEANNIVKENVEGVEIVKSFILQNRFCTRYRHVMKCAFKENIHENGKAGIFYDAICDNLL